MAFPASPLLSKVELLIAGVWTDVTTYVRNANNIVIQRGFPSEQGNTMTVDTCTFTLDNTDGRFSNRNPTSPYYGLLGRNVQCRVSAATVADRALYLYNRYDHSNTVDGRVQTTDKAVLDITGDIDIRGDILPTDWTPEHQVVLASKWESITGDQRSWYVVLQPDGKLQFEWSTLGTFATIQVPLVSTAAVATSGRKAWRVTVDVNNGAAGKTATFYTADTISGSWVQLGAPVITAGTTSIFSSSAPLVVGTAGVSNSIPLDVGDPFDAPANGFTGRYYGFQLYNGIAGTKVADADFAAQAAGTLSWSDGLGTPNTWTVSSTAAAISDLQFRYFGECSEFPATWDVTGTDVTVQMTASSVLRRIQHNSSPVDASMHRYLVNKSTLVSYLPLEDGSNATQASNLVSGVRAANITEVTFGSDADLPSSKGVATLTGGTSTIEAVNQTQAAAPGTSVVPIINFSFMFRYANATLVDTPDIVVFDTTGTVRTWDLLVDTTTFFLAGLAVDGTVLGSVFSAVHGMDLSEWVAIRIQVTTSGGNIDVRCDWHQVGDTTNHSMIRTNYCAGSIVGRVTAFLFNPFGTSFADNNGLKIAQVAILQEDLTADATNYIAAANSFLGESAGDRWQRLCGYADIHNFPIGDPSDTELMGPQTPNTLVNLMQECADVDGGFIFSGRDFNGLVMRTRNSMLAQTPTDLNYAANVFDDVNTFRPTDDDKVLVNDVTVTRPNGGTGQHVVTSGINNIDDPTLGTGGVGRYAVSYSLNAQLDSRLPNLAAWATYLGTWDQLRLPQFTVSLHRPPFVASSALTSAVIMAEIGDAFSVTNPPTWMPQEDLNVMFRGVTETIANRGWTFTFATQQDDPFRLILTAVTAAGSTSFRAAAAGSVLNGALNSSATSFSVESPSHREFQNSTTSPGIFPIQVMVGGELMSVGAIAASGGLPTNTQTFSSVTRSVNGVVKSHVDGVAVQVVDRFYAAL